MISNTFLRFTFVLLLFAFTINGRAQDSTQTIPEWFTQDMTTQIGTWKADNSAYQSEEEPYDAYEITWEWGIGATSMKGILFGIKGEEKEGPFGEYRQYWDNDKQEGVLMQYGLGGMIGRGKIRLIAPGETETLMKVVMMDGSGWKSRHHNRMSEGVFKTLAYELMEDKSWVERRNYTWTQKEEAPIVNALGDFSMSLAVKDLTAAIAFYQKLGFKPVAGLGGPDQKWIILQQSEEKIGLFQSLFPSNTLTFYPLDARALFKKVKAAGIEIAFAMGMDKTEGPCSFSISDPDGNAILFDQQTN